METIYFTTSNFIRHEGNLVDLTEYRRKLALATAPAAAEAPCEEEPAAAPRRRSQRRPALPGMMLDCAASVALIVTALTFAAKIL